jgi:hypothetical protein
MVVKGEVNKRRSQAPADVIIDVAAQDLALVFLREKKK